MSDEFGDHRAGRVRAGRVGLYGTVRGAACSGGGRSLALPRHDVSRVHMVCRPVLLLCVALRVRAVGAV